MVGVPSRVVSGESRFWMPRTLLWVVLVQKRFWHMANCKSCSWVIWDVGLLGMNYIPYMIVNESRFSRRAVVMASWTSSAVFLVHSTLRLL